MTTNHFGKLLTDYFELKGYSQALWVAQQVKNKQTKSFCQENLTTWPELTV